MRSVQPSFDNTTETIQTYESTGRVRRRRLALMTRFLVLLDKSEGICFHRRWFVCLSFFDRYFHIPLPIVTKTKHELGLPFPPNNLPIKFDTNPSTIFLVIVFTDKHIHKPTPVKHTPTLSQGELEIICTSLVAAKSAG